MRTVHKFPFREESNITIINGGDPKVLHVGVDPTGDKSLPTVWVELDPHDKVDQLMLTFIGTGHPVPADGLHVGSVVTPVGLVWHIYRKIHL
jgi:hypothetical protein